MAEAPSERLSLDVANEFSALARCAPNVRAFLARWQLSSDDVADVLVILDELASNVIRHAWPEGGSHRFSLAVAAKPVDRMIELSITLDDDGIAFDPTSSRPPARAPARSGSARGGFGLRLVAAMSDGITHSRSGGRNRVTVLKRVPVSAMPD
jgi:anti-sigma regulatory factor (Ser/Thr protein kinase)